MRKNVNFFPRCVKHGGLPGSFFSRLIASMNSAPIPAPAPPLRRPRLGYPIFDIEQHVQARSRKEVARRLPLRYRERFLAGYVGDIRPNLDQRGGGNRGDIDRSGGLPDGGCPEVIRREILDPYDVEWAIGTGTFYNLNIMPDADYAAAIASAVNDWMLEDFVHEDPRFLGSIALSMQDADLAVREIERCADRPRAVGIIISTASRMPLGNRAFHRIYEAAQAHGLPVAAHTTVEGRGTSGPPGSAGYPSRYLEFHTNLAASAITHAASLVCEGVFARFPNLRVVLLEGGISWVLPLMWKLDAEWRRLRSELPQLKERPSDYLRRQLFYTTQPIEEPRSPRHLLETYEAIGGRTQIMFSSDYPHWDFDDPFKILPGSTAAALKRRILWENALALYGPRLPGRPPFFSHDPLS